MPALAVTDSPRRLIVLAQFDVENGLPAHVRIHLECLRPSASKLVLVSNSPLRPEARARAQEICDVVLERENVGWDFAGWRDATAQENIANWDTVILTNSSIVGPLYPIAPVIEEMESRGADFWGLVHSKQTASHLQSFFLGFSKRVTCSAAWADFWADVEDVEDKWEVIRRYEVGLTKHFRRSGFTFDAYMRNPRFPKSIRVVDVERLGSAIRLPWDINRVGRTIRDHRAMIEEGFPYLKASLLWGRDRHRLESLEKIRSIQGTNYPWSDLRL